MNFTTLRKTLLFAISAVALFGSCKKDEPGTKPGDIITQDFQLAFASGSGSISGTYLQGLSDISTGNITFEGTGYSLTSSRTARIFVSGDGSTVYSLNYTVGTIDKLIYSGGDNYTTIKTFDSSIPLGVKSVRFTKLNEEKASVHYITSVAEYGGNNETDYLGHKMTMSIGILDLEAMNFGKNFNKEIDLQLPGTMGKEGYYIYRMDCPVISGNKIYYGAATRKFDIATAGYFDTDKALTIVLDYPSLTNATIIETTLAKGATNGYRTPTQHVNESGEILQMVSDGKDLNIVKIINGQYDNSYKFSISGLLGKEASSNGWFYAGNGIGYVPYEKVGEAQVQIGVNASGEPTYSSAWGLVRIDLNSKSLVDLETPKGLWLQQYQTSVVRDGKFYIALAPVGEQGYIYNFDINSNDSKGTQGAKIKAGADQYYIGIY